MFIKNNQRSANGLSKAEANLLYLRTDGVTVCAIARCWWDFLMPLSRTETIFKNSIDLRIP